METKGTGFRSNKGVLGQEFSDMATEGTGFRSNKGVPGQEFSDMETEGTGFRSNKAWPVTRVAFYQEFHCSQLGLKLCKESVLTTDLDDKSV